MEKKRVLFVDDEERVLMGLKRMLRPLRSDFEMDFAASGAEALEMMEQSSFDLIVSDMRMPGMDGAALLTEVQKRWPRTGRIVLSGQTDSDSMIRAIGSAHRYLSKPCDPESLRKVLKRTGSLREFLACPAAQELVGGLSALPSAPQVFLELEKELHSEEGSVEVVAQLIARDAAISSKVLQLVNSGYFGLSSHISDPKEAVRCLGLETVRSLVLSIDVFSGIQHKDIEGFSFEEHYRHSLITAVLAKQICHSEHCDKAVADDAFTAGLLHDIGKTVLALSADDSYVRVAKAAEEKGLIRGEAERECFGVDHAQLGAYLLALWGMPDSIVEAVAYHHYPERCVTESIQPLTAVHAADYFSDKKQHDGAPGNCPPISMEYLKNMGLEDHLPAWEAICQITLEEQLGEDIKSALSDA